MSASESLPLASPKDRAWSPPLPPADGITHRRIAAPGLRTHLAECGQGEPVLLLHGFPEHWWQWRDVATGLAAAGYRALIPDLRGAGWTEADSPALDRTSRLRDVLALLDALGLESVRLLSHDMGALTAMQLSYGHPERVLSAVQLSVPPAFFAFSPRIVPGFRHLPQFLLHRRGTSLRRIFSPAYVARGMTEEVKDRHRAPQRRAEVEAAVRTLPWRQILPEALRMSAGVYRRRRLAVPTMVVFDHQDRPWTEPVVRRISRHAPRCADRVELAFVEDAAHFLTDDAPEEVTALALEWFARTR
ncbi:MULTISPECIES: alpha/beta fold hydrolase [Brachybacterium]|uniref:Alpha/beta hydrolase n=2 Tax=Brachybacterium TaxID=43668 RepID=A0A426SP91_9MICO|nr:MULTISPECIES: alpha/beta hydrolase [Brachybacterium]RRR19985.1 alpha/beta hydrolase [Brachybacterium paraconglomeratum]GLI31834.1 putative epoxide hydrolase EphF [Brachybacterium conglomeratum]GLK03367.1 putative epoxide hydrolase EphF [Brachybacterium conglomeratum]